MQPEFSKLIHELQKETCPQRVLDEVGRRASEQGRAPGRLRLAFTLMALGVVTLCSLCMWRWNVAQTARQHARSAELQSRERVRVAHQAEDALGLVGCVLLHAGAHSEKVISERAVPPLRSSLETAKNKIIHNIPL